MIKYSTVGHILRYTISKILDGVIDSKLFNGKLVYSRISIRYTMIKLSTVG